MTSFDTSTQNLPKSGRGRRCWCGSRRLTPFNTDYLSCEDCETLLAIEMPADDITRVGDDERGFYGESYFFDRQRELGHPTVHSRASSDLWGRCLHWLRTAIDYRHPPGRSLELGCSHGGLVAMLHAAGFDATGLELSPWMVNFARKAFGVKMLQGPLEDQELEPGSYDLILAMDVLEHLPDPATTLGLAIELLRDDGMLLIQTPKRPSGISHQQLVDRDDPFLKMLLPVEHLHLFSEDGICQLLERLGAPHVAFEEALFADYDMFLAAGRRPLERIKSYKAEQPLNASPSGRLLQAMLALYQLHEMQKIAYEGADFDRVQRQRQIDDLHKMLERRTAAYEVADQDRIGRQEQIEEMHRILYDERAIRSEEEAHLRGEIDRLQQENDELRRTIEDLKTRAERR